MSRSLAKKTIYGKIVWLIMIDWFIIAICADSNHYFNSGHSREQTDGHAQFMQGIKPVIGYNGKYGYRRNNPWLRNQPSPFGTGSTSPTWWYDCPRVLEWLNNWQANGPFKMETLSSRWDSDQQHHLKIVFFFNRIKKNWENNLIRLINILNNNKN